tara:strand:- start:255 stop:725 length:471 start_codon:yes stop_codon:yes gene_type:complete
MEKKFIDYGQRINKALLQVVRDILMDLSEQKISSNHCFYITFDTGYKNVEISKSLKKDYPKEMTIILQNQFWDLLISEESFSVTLSFNRKRENLTIPFESIKRFNDPFVKFSLELDIRNKVTSDYKPSKDKNVSNSSSSKIDKNIVSLDNFRKKKD